ncbi:MAG: hypothetical protein DHS20C18_43370 [Saprospiraceae bacterium]|nr:MAG: hypothetical protein DHS20C18_43370 [Saprospiraceae bacterium]
MLPLNAQIFNVSVNADATIGVIAPLWNDFWELNVQHGYGLNAWIFTNSPHTPFIEDSGFLDAMNLLKPRSFKISIGSFVYLPHIDYASNDTTVLKSLPTEFYRGGNSLTEADDPDNYYFEYLDNQLNVLDSIGVEPFLNIDYMPFTLASNQIPNYHLGFPFPIAQLDNEIRTVPPQSNDVYARVVRNLIRHTKGLFKGTKDYGITYYEIWNEPDHPITNFPTFWRGTEYQLYDMYEAIVKEVNDDTEINDEIKIGCCSFAMLDATQETFVENFLTEIDNNNTRLDFLSVHPYSSDPFRSLDTAKLTTAQLGIDFYAPNAELINAEWGILNSSSLSFVNTLEHDLINFKDVSLMLDRNVKYAHYVGLVEYATSNGDPNIGVCSNNPIQAKITAIARANMNKLLETPNRLKVEGDLNEYLIAGTNDNQSKITLTLAGIKPENNQTNTINLEVKNIPFPNDYQVTIYELSETDYDNGAYFKIKDEFTDSIENLVISLIYDEDQNSGRLFTIVIADTHILSNSEKIKDKEKIKLYPNPATEQIILESVSSKEITFEEIVITNITGNEINRFMLRSTERIDLDISYLSSGLYFIRVSTNYGDIHLRFIKK